MIDSNSQPQDQSKLQRPIENHEKLLYLLAIRDTLELDEFALALAVHARTNMRTGRCGPAGIRRLARDILRQRTRTTHLLDALVKKIGLQVLPPAKARHKPGDPGTEYMMPWDGICRTGVDNVDNQAPKQRLLSANSLRKGGTNINHINGVSLVANDLRTDKPKKEKKEERAAPIQGITSAPSLATALDESALARALLARDNNRREYLEHKRRQVLAISAAKRNPTTTCDEPSVGQLADLVAAMRAKRP